MLQEVESTSFEERISVAFNGISKLPATASFRALIEGARIVGINPDEHHLDHLKTAVFEKAAAPLKALSEKRSTDLTKADVAALQEAIRIIEALEAINGGNFPKRGHKQTVASLRQTGMLGKLFPVILSCLICPVGVTSALSFKDSASA